MTALNPEYREEQVDAPALHPPGCSVSMTGKVRKPLTPTLNDLRRRPRVTQPSILERAGNGHGIDGACIIRSRGHCPVKETLLDGGIPAWELNGRLLPSAHGCPLRHMVPTWHGIPGVQTGNIQPL